MHLIFALASEQVFKITRQHNSIVLDFLKIKHRALGLGLGAVLDNLRTIDEKTVTVPFRHLREILILHIVAAMGWSQLFALLVHQDLGVFVESSISQVVMVWRGHHQLVVANTLRGMGEELVGKLVVKLH